MSRDDRRPRALPVTCALSTLPHGALDALARSTSALEAAALALARPTFTYELSILDALRRKSHAQHRASKHHSALARACARARDLIALDAAGAMDRLARDGRESVAASRVYGTDEITLPARASADDVMRACYASALACDDARRACEGVVEAFAAQLELGYFMPLSATASACASRARCECVRMISAYVNGYNVASALRAALPPPGRFGRDEESLGSKAPTKPPAELRVREREDGSTCACAVGDELARGDDELDLAWAHCESGRAKSVMGRDGDAAAAVLADLGVRVDRADDPKQTAQTVVMVMKASQVPKAPMRKYDTVRSLVLGGVGAPRNPLGSSKKRRRKKAGGDGDGDSKKKTAKNLPGDKRPSEAPTSAAEAYATLQRLSSFR